MTTNGIVELLKNHQEIIKQFVESEGLKFISVLEIE